MLWKIITRPVEHLGDFAIESLRGIGTMGMFIIQTVKWMFRPPLRIHSIVEQMLEVGVRSFPVVFFTALFTGMVLALQSNTGFRRFGAESMVGTLVALSMTRELGPVLTSLVVTGRAGSAMTASLGTMRVTEQIDALYTLAANPVKHLVVPRVVAGTLMMPVLTALADFVGIMGGFAVGVFLLKSNPVLYMEKTYEFLELNDIFSGLYKSMVFGFLISVVGCYEGFYTEGGAEGVGNATTRSVVLGFMLIFISNYILTALLFSSGSPIKMSG